jgi:hypothetical protein
MDFQKGSVLTKEKRQILLLSAKLLFAETRSQIYPFIRPISMEHLQPTNGLNLGGIFLPLAKQSNRESSLSNSSKRDSLMTLLITTKLLFGLFICYLFVSMYTPLFKFITPIGFGDKKLETNIFLQVCYYFNTNTILYYPYVES